MRLNNTERSPQPGHERSSRRGSSLAELMVTLCITGIVMGAAAELLHLMLGVDRGVRQDLVALATWDRLSTLFVRDVHATVAGAADSDAQTPTAEPRDMHLDREQADELRLERQDGTRVIYRAHRAGVERLVSGTGSLNQRDVFVFPRGEQPNFSLTSDATPRVRLTLQVGDDTGRRHGAGWPRVLVLEAAPGRDDRDVSPRKGGNPT